MAPLPAQPLGRVVAGPDVVRAQRLDAARVRDQIARRDLGPGADANPVGLRYLAVAVQQVRRRLAVRPDALLERAFELGVVRLAHEPTRLVVERRVEEEAVVLDLEVAVLLADAALAQGDELLP